MKNALINLGIEKEYKQAIK